MSLTSQKIFRRPKFSPVPPKNYADSDDEAISTLSDLIRFNSENNAEHIFCIQAQSEKVDSSLSGDVTYRGVKITFAQLDRAIQQCVLWLSDGYSQTFSESGAPIALYVESDVGLLIYLSALQILDIPLLLISARLSPDSVAHLLEKTGSKNVLVSKRTRNLLVGQLDDCFNMINVMPYTMFLDLGTRDCSADDNYKKLFTQRKSHESERSLILHSSGTTGFPKPIYLTKRYLLQYASCHEFPGHEVIDWVNLSTLPLYHGFGFLAPCLSLSVGMTCGFPPSSIISAGRSTLDLLNAFSCRSLMTVPSIVGDLMTQDGVFERLASLEFLAVGGGAMSPDQGLRLKEQNVNLLNHYGVTEIGAIAPIFRPGPDYNWRYLRLRSDLGLELHSIPSSSHFKLVGYPIGWGERFEVQDELEKNPDTVGDYLEVRILGRTDDVIVLKTGEKITPQQLERELMASPVIKTAICIGEGQFEVVVLVEPASYPLDEAEFIDQVWDLVSSKNTSLDRHAKVSSKKAIIVKPVGKMIPRTDKGSVSRRQVRDVFSDEIQAAYAAIEIDLPIQNLDWADLESSIRALVKGIFKDFDSSSDEDFFEAGMDSLQAVRLARQLNVSLQQSTTLQVARSEVSAELVYRHPTISALVEYVKAQRNNFNGEMETSTSEDNTARVKALSERFTANLYCEEDVGYPKTTKRVVLLTGATGNLGSHMLSQLVQNTSVSKVICLYRQTKDDNLLNRIRLSVSACGLLLDESCWAKVELVEAAEFIRGIGPIQDPVERDPNDGVSNGNDGFNLFTRLAQDVTHLVHLAWPIDFQRTLESFIPHIKMVEALINLARAAHTSQRARRQPPARLLFASSIAVVRNYGKEFPASSSSIIVPEEEMQTPETVAPMGYAEAKWVCERLLGHVGRHLSDEIEPVIVRIGQLGGPEASPGIWKTSEHIPALLKASHLVEAMPQLEGASPDRKMPYQEWLRKVSSLGVFDSLVDFFTNDFQDLALGKIQLDTKKAIHCSKTLHESRGVDDDLLIEYIRRWEKQGMFTKAAQ
ncbi:uncharacterized protein TRIVIDRAFT_194923 [Trichoderma virens Gv29-8]|uniref:Carrier domain-containing protein n=1 Tax=Hypocrea virens (strain Gv29-8 / FGSC 10586) TaxID=413071 RepID=G9N6M5_HYPVG|nr:uncharacterized protein TRIVIDRAFT_194923 [Trichoderma virens Gv29-8]EHK17809.1 hypothetical protein TRIVIDRAFT_194923 [Trichoderma virens Gv29-8]UKZ53504.1 putative NRPS-like protein biosynthetic cluster [Trichoderma virens]